VCGHVDGVSSVDEHSNEELALSNIIDLDKFTAEELFD